MRSIRVSSSSRSSCSGASAYSNIRVDAAFRKMMSTPPCDLNKYCIPGIRAGVDVDNRTISLSTSAVLDGQSAENGDISNRSPLTRTDIHRGGACNVDEPSQGSCTCLGERFQLHISSISHL